MSGLERETPGVYGNTLSLMVIPLGRGLQSDAKFKKIAFVSEAEWPCTASVSGMQCMHGGHVG